MTAEPAAPVARFDPAEPFPAGRTVIEASAGTGKTFTIAAAVTRLVAVEGLDLEDMLVVTFTRAATAELRDRVRRRMVESLRALRTGSDPSDGDRHLAVLLSAGPGERTQFVRRLDGALTGFDRAQISTIHGFARRLLGHLGFLARFPPGAEPGEVDDLLLAQVAGDLVVGRYAAGPGGIAVVPGHVAAIARAALGTPDARIVPDPGDVAGAARDRVELGRAAAVEAMRRMRRAGLVTYDDGPVEVRDALADPEVGAAARDLLRRRYSIALVDESQDTDPIQWQIIRSVFDEARLVVIGDPKQSIYSFRGADVEAYTAAVRGAAAVRTLSVNWRSDGPLIRAVDTLFRGATFGEGIPYRPVEPAPGHEATRIHGAGAPLEVRRFHDDYPVAKNANSGRFYVRQTRRAVAADAAAEIVRMLEAGITIDASTGTTEPLGPADIAVLCRTNEQVEMIRAELAARSVPSVAARTGGVFLSPAAEEWRRLLPAIERPERFDRIRLAATTVLVGRSPADLAAMNDEELLALQERARDWNEVLHTAGVAALVARIDRTTDLARRVLARPDGERMMTDLIHIAEEMHAVWRRGRTVSLLAWLEATMDEAERRADARAEEPESRQRRLETDADAVQVQTVHGAKGLQYPVVLVPYAWDPSTSKPQIPVFHDPDAPEGDVARPRLIDVSGSGPDYERHRSLAVAEKTEEEGRHLYVAVTRAEHRLTMWWVEQCYNSLDSKLHEVITRDGRTVEDLVGDSAGAIDVVTVTEPASAARFWPGEAGVTPVLERSRLRRPLDHHWRRASFTSLSPDHLLASTPERSEAPLRADETALVEADEAAPGVRLPMAELPRGARFGTLVHSVLEAVPLDTPDLGSAIRQRLTDELRRSSWDFDPEALVSGLTAAAATPLGPGDTARPADLHRRLVELPFELPVAVGGGTVSLADIGAAMLEHLPDHDPYRAYARERLLGIERDRFRGFLTGTIDLAAEIDDRYVVIDFKSNVLPAEGAEAGPTDYGPGALRRAMMDGDYVLQSTLYQVALHRYLQWRLPGYDPGSHLGGSMYLFLRGMAGPGTPVVDGERCGVARWVPPSAMVEALSRLFEGGAA